MANLKASTGMTLLIVILSLATWVFFYVESMGLNPAGTAVVCGGWALLVLSGKWLWSRRDKHRGKK
jgi:hypothetical protein